MTRLALAATLIATPALAAGDKPFFSLANTDFVVSIAFLVFIGILFYFKVPGMIGGMLDKRAEGIAAELDEARKLREEAQTVLASYERKQREVQGQADQIVEHARQEASLAAEQAKQEIASSIARRLQAAEDRIASAEAGALRDVRDRATEIAIAAASSVIAGQMDGTQADKLIDDAIATVDAKLH